MLRCWRVGLGVRRALLGTILLGSLAGGCSRSGDSGQLASVRAATRDLERQVQELRRQLATTSTTGPAPSGSIPVAPTTQGPGAASGAHVTTGALPAGFPAGFPNPPGLVVVVAASGPGPVFRISFSVPGTFDETVAFYKRELASRGAVLHDNVASQSNGARSAVMVFDGFGGVGSVLVVTLVPGGRVEGELKLRAG